MWTALQRTVALATIIATTTATGVLAQATAADPNSTEMDAMETAPSDSAGGATDQAQDAQPEQPGMMSEPMGQGTMGSGMMCSEMCAGMMDQGRMDQRRTDDSAMDQGMQGHGGMGPRTTSGMMHPGMMGTEMHEQMMKIVFALADADGNGGLSLDELATIQTRIFAAVDADKDGNVKPEELQAFIRE